MAWLIEAYLNEEMKTAADFHNKKELEQWFKKRDEDAEIDREINRDIIADKNTGKDAIPDAVDRHNRRHPDRKVASECADIIEMLQ